MGTMSGKKDDILNAKDLDIDEPETDDLENEEELSDEELRLYFGIAFCSIVAIAINIRSLYPTVSDTVRHAAFHVEFFVSVLGEDKAADL